MKNYKRISLSFKAAFNEIFINSIKKKPKAKTSIKNLLDTISPHKIFNARISLMPHSNKKIFTNDEKKRSIDTFSNRRVDKKLNIIYNWRHLFTYSNKGIYYKKSQYKKLEEPKQDENDSIKFVKNPILLVDLGQDKINKFFYKNKKKKEYLFHKFYKKEKNDNDNISFKIRPVSSERKPNETFYFADFFSEYYKDNPRYHSKKPNFLRPLIKIEKNRLFEENKKQRPTTSKNSTNLKGFNKKRELILRDIDLYKAGEKNNPKPLLESIFQQNHPNVKLNINKKNYKTIIEERKNNKIYQENKAKSFNKKRKLRLILSYYNNEDPDILKFKNLISKISDKRDDQYSLKTDIALNTDDKT